MAASALEQALAQSFAVQESPAFLRMRAAVQAAQRKFPEALTTLEAAMRIPGVAGAKSGGAATAPGGRIRGGAAAAAAAGAPAVSLNDRAGIYVLLAEVQLELGNVAAATTTIADAMAEFAVRRGREVQVVRGVA